MNWWILKPAGSSRGRGISLLNDIGKVTYGDTAVIQRYLYNPLLLDGYKFDLRIYVLVSSFDPLRAYVFEEGLVRFSTEKYAWSEQGAASLHNQWIAPLSSCGSPNLPKGVCAMIFSPRPVRLPSLLVSNSRFCSVKKNPGAKAFTRMGFSCFCANSMAKNWVRFSIPAFAEA